MEKENLPMYTICCYLVYTSVGYITVCDIFMRSHHILTYNISYICNKVHHTGLLMKKHDKLHLYNNEEPSWLFSWATKVIMAAHENIMIFVRAWVFDGIKRWSSPINGIVGHRKNTRTSIVVRAPCIMIAALIDTQKTMTYWGHRKYSHT